MTTSNTEILAKLDTFLEVATFKMSTYKSFFSHPQMRAEYEYIVNLLFATENIAYILSEVKYIDSGKLVKGINVILRDGNSFDILPTVLL